MHIATEDHVLEESETGVDAGQSGHGLFGLDRRQVWNADLALRHLQAHQACAKSGSAAQDLLQNLNLLPALLAPGDLRDDLGRSLNHLVLDHVVQCARSQGRRLLFAQLYPLPGGAPCLHAHDEGSERFWIPLALESREHIAGALRDLQRHIGEPVTVIGHAALVAFLRELTSDAESSVSSGSLPLSSSGTLQIECAVYRPRLPVSLRLNRSRRTDVKPSPHLKRLEAQSIHIIREAVAEAQNPAMLYSIGKDSGVMLHLARKAFYPAVPPFPLLHVDTRWKFQEMYAFRDFVARQSGMELLVHVNPDAIGKDINPFDHGSALHTDITKTEGLKQALDHHRFDVVFGGARRDEEKSRAKERVFSFRTASHRWDPKQQRPELWDLYNTRKGPDESIRVFPLSNWTELDIWQYIYQEDIPVVPLYFARPRPVVVRPGMIMMVDDERCRLLPNEQIQMRKVRFRTLGCYPLTGAVESDAETLEDILLEIIHARQSERQGRKIDSDSAGSMEKKKQEGYF